MKCQNLFSGKNKKNIIYLSSAEEIGKGHNSKREKTVTFCLKLQDSLRADFFRIKICLLTWIKFR